MVNIQLIDEIKQLNPWLDEPGYPIVKEPFIPRSQVDFLLNPEWDALWTILVGPRRAGKTTLGKYLSKVLLEKGRFENLLYLNCDYLSIRQWLSSPLFISQALNQFSLKKPILFIDEVQRIRNPGLLLKAVIDLDLDVKYIASGSSQLEMQSNVQEHLTGRQLASITLPLNNKERPDESNFDDTIIYGSYPQVCLSSSKEVILKEIYKAYIQKDIVEILKVGKPDVFQNLISLLAHNTGQLANINQLSVDCKASTTTVRNYLDILEKTFVTVKIKPFVGNKRAEVTSNPIYYFLDNGFRNVALRNFNALESRVDLGLLIESFVFQELYKFKSINYIDLDIHYWRTKSGAEVDFVLYKNDESFIPIEVKYRTFTKPTIKKGFRSFLDAYKPKSAIIITKDYINEIVVGDTTVYFIPLRDIGTALSIIEDVFCGSF